VEDPRAECDRHAGPRSAVRGVEAANEVRPTIAARTCQRTGRARDDHGRGETPQRETEGGRSPREGVRSVGHHEAGIVRLVRIDDLRQRKPHAWVDVGASRVADEDVVKIRDAPERPRPSRLK
jgi:hypothetical protein